MTAAIFYNIWYLTIFLWLKSLLWLKFLQTKDSRKMSGQIGLEGQKPNISIRFLDDKVKRISMLLFRYRLFQALETASVLEMITAIEFLLLTKKETWPYKLDRKIQETDLKSIDLTQHFIFLTQQLYSSSNTERRTHTKGKVFFISKLSDWSSFLVIYWNPPLCKWFVWEVQATPKIIQHHF